MNKGSMGRRVSGEEGGECKQRVRGNLLEGKKKKQRVTFYCRSLDPFWTVASKTTRPRIIDFVLISVERIKEERRKERY